MKQLRRTLQGYKSTFLCLCLLFILLTVLVPLSEAANQAKPKLVRVGWAEDTYNYVSRNGERSGYCYDYAQAVASYTGWKYEYVEAGWDELMQMLQRGEIDLMAPVSYSQLRAQSMLFSEKSIGKEKYYLYADAVDAGISASDLQTLNGKRIAVLANSVVEQQFANWQTQHKLNLEKIAIVNFDDLTEQLKEDKLDGFVYTEASCWGTYGMSKLAVLGESDVYFAISPKRPDLKAELDTAMLKIEESNPYYTNELYKRYLSEATRAALTAEEKAWLQEHGPIRLGHIKDATSFNKFDEETGKPIGVIYDYINFAADCLGKQALSFELVDLKNQATKIQALKEKKVDMLFHFTQNPYIAEQNGFILSNAAMTLPLVIVTNQSYFKEDAANIVAVKKENLLAKWHASYSYPQWKFIECASQKEMEQAVLSGKADCMVVRSNQLNSYAGSSKFHGVSLTKPGQVVFAVNRDDTILLSILNKTLKTMPPSMLSSAFSMYNSTAKKMTLKDLLRENWHLVVMAILSLMVILELLRRAKIAEATAKEAAAESMDLNKKLKEAVEVAEQANAAKTNFLFSMSHDIRTPMNAILGYAKMMKEELKGLNNHKLLDYEAKMEMSGNLLLSILNNVLDMARIESGKMELEESYNVIGTINAEVRGVFAEEAKQKHIRLLTESDIQHKAIMCDVTKVKEIFTNLISNAIKYTPEGGTIILRITELPSDKPGYLKLKTDIIDTGVGMSKEFLPTIFEPFTRERNTTIGKVAGTGLGVPIVKKLVELMGGTITVESELGKGSTFSFILEYKIADDMYFKKPVEQQEKNGSELLKGKHVLIAEDNELNVEIATYILEAMGLIVERVEDGVQCVKRMQEKPAGTYDLILMDIQMPNMDGYQATKAIRALEDKAKATIPIVAMTANAFESDRQNAIEVGMNDHIAKPIDAAKVEQTLVELFRK